MHNPIPLSPVVQPTFLSAAPSANVLADFIAASTGRQAAPAATPAVCVIARRLGVDVARVKGTGTAGQVTIADVRGAASAKGGQ